MESEKEREKDWWTRVFQPGTNFKIYEKSGQAWTVQIVLVEGEHIHFTDKFGKPGMVHKDEIRSYREIRRDSHGN